MITEISNANPYIRYLQLSDTLIEQSEASYFRANEKEFFEFILLQLSRRTNLTVNEVINYRRFGSTSTVHKKLQRLIDDQKLCVARKQGDGRVKCISLASKGQIYINLMNECLSFFANDCLEPSSIKKLHM